MPPGGVGWGADFSAEISSLPCLGRRRLVPILATVYHFSPFVGVASMTILVATDFSENSRAALHLGARLARSRGKALHLLHVVDLAADDNAWRVLVEAPREIEDSALVEAREKLEKFYDANLEDVQKPTAVRFEARIGNPITELLAVADELPDPLIIAGTRGGSRLQQLFLGSTSHRLVRQSRHPVILAPPLSGNLPLKTFIVAIDFSDTARALLTKAAEFAREEEAELHLIHGFVIPEVTALQASMATVSTEMDDLIRDKRKAMLDLVQELGADDVVQLVEVRPLPPAMSVMAMVEDYEAHMIFIGTHGRRGWSRFFLGNTAERLMRRAPCPMFVLPALEAAEED